MHDSHDISLLIITALAVTVPLLASRFRKIKLPIVGGEITAGIAIGVGGLNLIKVSEALAFLQDLGFAYLMLLSGLEADLCVLKRPHVDVSGVTASLGIVLPVLKEKHLLDKADGQCFLLAALVADFVTLTLLPFVASTMGKRVTLNFVLVMLLGVAFAVTVKVRRVFAAVPLMRQVIDALVEA